MVPSAGRLWVSLRVAHISSAHKAHCEAEPSPSGQPHHQIFQEVISKPQRSKTLTSKAQTERKKQVCRSDCPGSCTWSARSQPLQNPPSSSAEGIARFFLMCNAEKMIQVKIWSWDGAGKRHGGGAGGGRASGPPPPLHPFSCPRVHPLGGFCQNPLQAGALPKCLPSPPLPAPPSGSAPQRPNTSGFHGSLIFNEHRSSPNRNESVSLMRAGHAGISPGRQQLPPKLAPSARGGFFFIIIIIFTIWAPPAARALQELRAPARCAATPCPTSPAARGFLTKTVHYFPNPPCKKRPRSELGFSSLKHPERSREQEHAGSREGG